MARPFQIDEFSPPSEIDGSFSDTEQVRFWSVGFEVFPVRSDVKLIFITTEALSAPEIANEEAC